MYIFSFLDDLLLIKVSSTCKQFYNLLKKQRDTIIYEFWKNSYPSVYKIPEEVFLENGIEIYIEKEEEDLEYDSSDEEGLSSVMTKKTVRYLSHSNYFTDDELDLCLNYLKDEVPNLRRGDIIHILYIDYTYNERAHIFDGEKIVRLDQTISKEGSVPSEFKVIDEFPIKYFHHNCFSSGRKGIRGNIVQFDHMPYLDQILTNINCEGGFLNTFFTHKNMHKYFIVFDIPGYLILGDFIKSLFEDILKNMSHSSDTFFTSKGVYNNDFYRQREVLFIQLKDIFNRKLSEF